MALGFAHLTLFVQAHFLPRLGVKSYTVHSPMHKLTLSHESYRGHVNDVSRPFRRPDSITPKTFFKFSLFSCITTKNTSM